MRSMGWSKPLTNWWRNRRRGQGASTGSDVATAAGAASADGGADPGFLALAPLAATTRPVVPTVQRDATTWVGTWRPPTFMTGVDHLVDPAAPAGVVPDLARPSAPLTRPGGPIDLPLAPPDSSDLLDQAALAGTVRPPRPLETPSPQPHRALLGQCVLGCRQVRCRTRRELCCGFGTGKCGTRSTGRGHRLGTAGFHPAVGRAFAARYSGGRPRAPGFLGRTWRRRVTRSFRGGRVCVGQGDGYGCTGRSGSARWTAGGWTARGWVA